MNKQGYDLARKGHGNTVVHFKKLLLLLKAIKENSSVFSRPMNNHGHCATKQHNIINIYIYQTQRTVHE